MNAIVGMPVQVTGLQMPDTEERVYGATITARHSAVEVDLIVFQSGLDPFPLWNVLHHASEGARGVTWRHLQEDPEFHL